MRPLVVLLLGCLSMYAVANPVESDSNRFVRYYEFESSDDDLDQDHELWKRQASNEFRQKALQVHNELRAKHGAPPLSLDESLNSAAQSYAQTEASTNVQKHSCGPCEAYGENLAYSASTAPVLKDAAAAEWACNSWYAEIKDYNFQSPNLGNFHKWGHLSALLWKSTQKMGIGIAYGSKTSASGNKMNTVYVVARYTPAGNTLDVDVLKANVLAQG